MALVDVGEDANEIKLLSQLGATFVHIEIEIAGLVTK
jgi:hypothetical protein